MCIRRPCISLISDLRVSVINRCCLTVDRPLNSLLSTYISYIDPHPPEMSLTTMFFACNREENAIWVSLLCIVLGEWQCNLGRRSINDPFLDSRLGQHYCLNVTYIIPTWGNFASRVFLNVASEFFISCEFPDHTRLSIWKKTKQNKEQLKTFTPSIQQFSPNNSSCSAAESFLNKFIFRSELWCFPSYRTESDSDFSYSMLHFRQFNFRFSFSFFWLTDM